MNNFVEIEILCTLCGVIITGRVKKIKNAICWNCRMEKQKQRIIKKQIEEKTTNTKPKEKIKKIHQKMWLSRMFT